MTKKHSTKKITPAVLLTTVLALGFGAPEAKETARESGAAWEPQGDVFQVFRHQKDRQGHDSAIVSIVQTGTKPDEFGLVFVQTKGKGHKGLGMVCRKAERLVRQDNGQPDSAFRCDQVVDDTREEFTVGIVGSAFCAAERIRMKTIGDTNADKKTYDGKNPVVDQEKCDQNYGNKPSVCVCYRIEHFRIKKGNNQGPGTVPPGNGSGSGGGGGGGGGGP